MKKSSAIIKGGRRDMQIGWNVICSFATAGSAVIALMISCQQIALSNRQCLFERRLKVYMLIQGLLELCEEYWMEF